MKKIIQLILPFLLILVSLHSFAQKEKKRYEHFKERTISKTYTANGNTLVVDNSFGDVVVSTWDKNEIKVEIHIEASSNNEAQADAIFENLDVEESKDGNKIKLKTITSKKKDKYNCKNCNSTMQINYTIQLPASTALRIENSFGGIQVPDYNGAISLTSKFGNLTTGKLAKAENISVEFGKANIKSMGNIDAVFKFSTITIDNLSGANKIKMEFCSSSRIYLDNDVSALNLNESYSTVNLKPASNFSATYHIRSSFGSVKDRSNANIKRTDKPDEYGPDSEKEYEGQSGSGSSKIEIKSSFGKIIIGEATEEEMKEKEKKNQTTNV